MSRARRRVLSGEERRLWATIARHVTPLHGRPAPEPDPSPAPALPAGPPPPSPRTPAPAGRPVPAAPVVPPLVPLDRKARTALRRGARRVDAVVDLHGMRQDEAHAALLRFLARAQREGHALVLVVTGKGGAAVPGFPPFEERGVLRRVVPHWLRLPELRGLVLGFEEATAPHGGAGALYVRLRRHGRF